MLKSLLTGGAAAAGDVPGAAAANVAAKSPAAGVVPAV